MSLKTWKEEYYPVDAKEAAIDDRTAILHSIKKWTGLLPENLKRHEVMVQQRFRVRVVTDLEITEELPLPIEAHSCALCRLYIFQEDSCDKCPLSKHLFGRCDLNEESPFQVFDNTGNPQPMLEALLETLKEFDAGELGEDTQT